MLKKKVTRAECRCEFDVSQEGSVLKDTYRSVAREFRTCLILDSPESEADIARIIRLAKRSCFAEQLIPNPVPLVSTYIVNGIAMDIDLS
jgi:hypothetical protein